MLDFIANPMAGGKNGKKMHSVLAKLESRLKERNVEYTIHITHELKQSRTKTEELIKNGATTIIAVGGDGTIHEVLNGFCQFDRCDLGIIPCGTGNDFASAIGLPTDPVDALDVILDGTPKYTDFMQMPGVRGLNIIGTGIDVDVLKRYNSLKKKTKFGYTWSLIKTLLNFKYIEFDAVIDGKTERYRSFIAGIANGTRYGGGIKLCPDANASDNYLDFVAVKEMGLFRIIKAFTKLKKGNILNMKETTHKKMKSVKIITDTPVTVNVDGELYDGIPFEVEIVSNTLRIYR